MTTTFPDSPLATEAEQIATAAYGAGMMNHCKRTFLLGKAYATVRGADFDEEGLYLAALFHDLGLCESHRDRSRPFTRCGSQALRGFMDQHDEPAPRAAVLAEAIDLHMQLLPLWGRGEVVGLLQVGAWMDMTGLRRWSVSDQARQIAQALPREGFGMVAFNFALLGSIGSAASCIGLLAPSWVK